MEDQLVIFETAKLAKEKGFDWDTFFGYNEEKEVESAYAETGEYKFTKEDIQACTDNEFTCYLAPTQSLLQKWLREQEVIIEIMYGAGMWFHRIAISEKEDDFYLSPPFKTYEDSLEAALQHCLTNFF